MPFRTAAEAEAALGRVVAHLRGGGLPAYPTETVYGLGSRPRAGEVRALAELKGRRPDKPFLLLVASREMAEAQGLAFNESASALARAFWPGPLTLVLPGGGGRLPDSLRGPEGGIAVRWTSHPHTARLVAALGEPLTSTSAHVPGAAPAPGADAIARGLAPAGTGAWDGAPASEGAYLVGLERGLDLSGHRARLLTRELVEEADLILTMARHHRARVDELGGEGRVFVLGEYGGREGDEAEVSDPFGGDLDVYRDTCAELEALVTAVVERLAKEGQHGARR